MLNDLAPRRESDASLSPDFRRRVEKRQTSFTARQPASQPSQPRVSISRSVRDGSRTIPRQNVEPRRRRPIVGQSRIAVSEGDGTFGEETAGAGRRGKNDNEDERSETSEVSSKEFASDPGERSVPDARGVTRRYNFLGIYVVLTHPELPAAAVIQLQEVSLDSGTSLPGAAHNSVSRWRLPGDGDAVVLGATLLGDQQRRSGC